MNLPTLSQVCILVRLRRPYEPWSRPPSWPSPGEVETGGYGSGRTEPRASPRVEKSASKRREHSESQSCDDTILGILRIFRIYTWSVLILVNYVTAGVEYTILCHGIPGVATYHSNMF